MKKIRTIAIVAGLCSCLQASAQSTCIPVPDSIGKYLASIFLQRADISKTAAFPDQKSIEEIETMRAQGLEEPVDVAVAIEGTENNTESVLRSQWEQLLAQATAKKVTAANTFYEQTYFSEQTVPKYPDKKYYTLFIAFKQANTTIAIEAQALFDHDKWAITSFGDAILRQYNRRKNEITFNGQSIPANTVKVTLATPKENNTNAGLKGSCLGDPEPFIKKTIQDLAAHKPASQFSGIITEADFNTYAQPELITLLDKAIKAKSTPASELKELKTMLNEYRGTPGLAYKKHLIDDITQMSAYLYERKFTAAAVQQISYNIKNYEQQVWGNGKIILEADVTIKGREGKEGIRFSGYWLNGKWQLLYMQSTTYGIEEAN
jgi:hypothetical protein